MKRYEAERLAIEEGKKIRHMDWSPNKWIKYGVHYQKGDYYWNEKDRCWGNILKEADRWEIYEEECNCSETKPLKVVELDENGKCTKCGKQHIPLKPKPSPKLPEKMPYSTVNTILVPFEDEKKIIGTNEIIHKINKIIDYLKEMNPNA